tara:strand:- start:441 stop:665 length:225 start_codon:yes stop_codon:yes gene_type:complete
VLKIHRVYIPPSPDGEGVLIQAQYSIIDTLIDIVKITVHNIIDDVIGEDISENLDLISELFMVKLVEADLTEYK